MLQTNQSRFFFASAALAADALEVAEFTGVEEISRPYRFSVRLVSDDPELDLDAVVGRPATLRLRRHEGDPLPIGGVVADVRQGGYDARRYAYEVTLVPRLWLLTLSHQSRVFQQLTVEQIVAEVLKQGGLGARDFRFVLTGALPVREYCVQYRESDLDFVQRLLEHEGIYYFFEQSADGRETVVFTDDRGESPDVDGGRTLEYHPGAGLVAAEGRETVREMTVRRQLVTGRVILKDYNYRTPETQLLARAQLDGPMPGVYYDYGAHFKNVAEGERLARVRGEEFEARRQLFAGESDCAGLRAGHVFALAEHFRGDCNADYLVTRVEHEGSQGAAFGVGDALAARPVYLNRFAAIPAATQYRPPRATPLPRVSGVITARVESAGGDYAYLDDQGRYRVKLPFDLSDRGGGAASRAVRMAQPYSGQNYGVHFTNRAGAEMVLACVDGDVDRPIGLSTVPNPSTTSPAVAANNAQCVIRTAGQNELTFDDTGGAENVLLHGTRDWTISVNHDKNQTVGNSETLGVKVDRAVTVGANQTTEIGADHRRHVKANETIAVDANRDKTVGGNQSETVRGDKRTAVAGSHTEHIGGNMTQTVSSASAETVALAKALSIGAGYQVSVVAAMNETVGGLKAEEIGGAKMVTVMGLSSEDVGVNKSVTAGGSISHEATGGDVTEKAGANIGCEAGRNFRARAGSDVAIAAGKRVAITAGDDLTIAGRKNGVVEAKDAFVLRCGSASISMKSNGDITIDGKKITINGSGDVLVKGRTVAINP